MNTIPFDISKMHTAAAFPLYQDPGGLNSWQYTETVHDGLKSYDGYSCKQALCNEHHHRELNAVVENEKQLWAEQMIELLYEIKKRKEDLIQDGHYAMDPQERAAFEDRYRMIVKIGLAENPTPPPPIEKKRGRVKQSKTKNLLDRLNTKRDAALAFMHDFGVPFTNNEAERAIRMLKNQQKISGSFRSMEGAKILCRIRGFVSTLRKHNLPVLSMLRRVLKGDAIIPEPTTTN